LAIRLTAIPIPGMPLFRAGLGLLLLCGRLAAAESTVLVGEAETLQPPTAARLAGYAAAARQSGWGALTPGLRAAALGAYGHGRLPAAEAWYYVYRWSALLAETEAQFIPAWLKAIASEHVGHPNMARSYAMRPQPLGQKLSPELQAWLVGNAAFSSEFFGLLSPVDYLPGVFGTLDELHRHSPARFARYPHLALALALVYDLPPPPDWPHGQASETSLPRRLPDVVEAFDWWIRQDQLGRTDHRLTDLGADELKFVVDAAAPFPELEWAQKNIDLPLNQLARAYTMVRYRTDRAAAGAYVWADAQYTLPAILAEGGICVDQAYFAAQVGKARGVPTLLFRGAGRDGRHAWFGFLDARKGWQLNAGRFGEQRFVTGLARDPQTWGDISDHELQFLAERFRTLPAFRTSGVHEEFAADLLQAGDAPSAVRAAWTAIRSERRNLNAWFTLLAAQQARRDGPKEIEATLYQAVAAFAVYPDLEAGFSSQLCQSLRARGQLSAAEFEEQRIVTKNGLARSDLALQQARENLRRIMATRPLAERIRAYNTLVDTMGQGAGIEFYDRIVTFFIEHLVVAGRPTEARQAAERARAALYVPGGSQLEAEFAKLLRDLPTAPAPSR
jgi:hypothetical protein